MYAEALYDSSGNILACYCADTLAREPGGLLLRFKKTPAGLAHARLNIDTVTAMEIEGASGARAVVGADGAPRIVNMDRAEYIMKSFTVDLGSEVAVCGVPIRGLSRKAT